MRLRFMLLAAVALSLMFTSPAAAQFTSSQTVVDRNAVAITYAPTGPGASILFANVSYRFGPTWDLLVGYGSAPGGATDLRIGARLHGRSPTRGVDPYLTLEYSSETPAATAFLVGAGITAQVAPRVDLFGALSYHSTNQLIYYNLGLQYQVSPQFSFVGGINSGLAYVGFAMGFGR